jgi:hypothetical protein
MSATADRWLRLAVMLREDAQEISAERPMLLHAAVIIETAAATFEERMERITEQAFGAKP